MAKLVAFVTPWVFSAGDIMHGFVAWRTRCESLRESCPFNHD
jgi:hypothetical protein